MSNGQLYEKYAAYYDKIYSYVDYEGESKFINWAVNEHKTSSGVELLDVACGTGSHALILKNDFNITGLDINENMLKIAREKVVEANFVQGDMKKLEINVKFDVIICIFSAIHYNTNYKELECTLKNFYNHMKNGGILIYDLSFNTDNWIEGIVSVDTVAEDKLKIARICQSRLENGIFNANFVFLVKDNDKFDFDIDEHRLGVFEIDKVNKIMEKVGFKTFIYGDFTFETWKGGECQRPIYVGIKNTERGR
ncbi:MAG: class I SAM-dependent methyltransferase [Methanobacterium sp.]|uniref:class I SAM-dependent DNA methyltransferase n=1 Tax=Methanobacterium sp. TaxID=2164 RepID=UPI003C754042